MRTREKLVSIGLLALMAFSFLAVFAPVTAVSPPLVFNSNAVTGISNNLITQTLPVTAGNVIIVEEWIGPGIGNNTQACGYLSTPTDSLSNTFTAIGSCLPDNNGAAMEAYKATNGGSTTTDLINCNYHNPNTQTESCYMFHVANAGTISALATGVGIGNLYNTTTATASANALLLLTAGIQYHCAQIVGANQGLLQYHPNSACAPQPGQLFLYGMAGGLLNVNSSGLTSNFVLSAGSQNVIWAEEVVMVAAQSSSSSSSTSTITSFTATVTGWLMPDSAHFANTYVLIIFPLAGMIFSLIPFMVFQKNKEIGDKAIFPMLFGLMIGSAAADISVNPSTPLTIPFADTFVAGFLLFMWWWNS